MNVQSSGTNQLRGPESDHSQDIESQVLSPAGKREEPKQRLMRDHSHKFKRGVGKADISVSAD